MSSIPGTPLSVQSVNPFNTPTAFRTAGVDAEALNRELREEVELTGWKRFRTRSTYYVPLLHWLPRYKVKQYLVGDVISSLTVSGVVGIFFWSWAMSYATALAHVPAVMGIFAIIVPSFVYGILGTCREPGIGPEASLSLLIGESINKIIEIETHAHGPMTPQQRLQVAMTVATTVTFEAGVIAFGLGFLRLGFLDAVLSKALLRGFLTALACVISIGQAVVVLGLRPDHPVEKTLDKVFYIIEHLQDTHYLTLAVAVGALVFLVVSRMLKTRLKRRHPWVVYFPEIFSVVLLSTVLSYAFDWQSHGLSVLGPVSISDARIVFPLRTISAGGLGTSLLGTSTVVAILGFLDTIVGAKDSASRNDYAISPNRELVAVGASNFFCSFVYGAMPGFGSITRSRLTSASGAKTQLVSLLTGSFVLLTTFFLLPYASTLPICTLSAILCLVIYSLFAETPHDVRFFWGLRAYSELGLMALTFTLTLITDVEVGIMVSIAVSIALCIKKSSEVTIKILGRVPGTNKYDSVDDPVGEENDEDYVRFVAADSSDSNSIATHSLNNSVTDAATTTTHFLSANQETPGVFIVRIRDINLNFANAGALKERLRRLERYGKGKHHPSERPSRQDARVVVFHLLDVESVDASALQILYETAQSYINRGVALYWTHLKPNVRLRLAKAGVLALCGGPSHVQPNVHSALTAAESAAFSQPISV